MNNTEKRVGILGLATAVPDHRLDRADFQRRMLQGLEGNADLQEWFSGLVERSGVDRRFSCTPDLFEPGTEFDIRNPEPPRTARRMTLFKEESARLGALAAERALQDYCTRTETDRAAVIDSITHVIALSCTGWSAPGLDFMLMEKLGLSTSVQRILMGQTGCAAGMTGLRLARQIITGEPDARVLIVCVELATLHPQPFASKDKLFPTVLFGDGAAACLVGQVSDTDSNLFEIGRCRTAIIPGSSTDTIIDIGDYGLSFRLSPRLPLKVSKAVAPEVAALLDGTGIEPAFWAVHPGGPAIVDAVESSLGLTEEQVRLSRYVLNQYGNLSSATILFVLNEMRWQMAQDSAPGSRTEGVAMSFGPGLTGEFALLTYVAPAVASSLPAACPAAAQ